LQKTGVGLFANGLEEGNQIVARAIRVTLGHTRCMFGTCATLAVEIKENTITKTIGVWTYAIAID
jgi:hypothetical protein